MSAKTRKSIDQRAPQIGYEGIKSLRSLDTKNYLVTGGLLSLVESYNNQIYHVFSMKTSDKLHNFFILWRKYIFPVVCDVRWLVSANGMTLCQFERSTNEQMD